MQWLVTAWCDAAPDDAAFEDGEGVRLLETTPWAELPVQDASRLGKTLVEIVVDAASSDEAMELVEGILEAELCDVDKVVPWEG